MKNYFFTFSIIWLFTLGCTKNDGIDMNPLEIEGIISPEQLANLANYSEENGGSSVLLMQHGSIIFEDYHNGANQNTATHLRSATKLFWSSAAALLKQQGLIDYEEYVSSTITEWQDINLHPNKDQIKIAHLLTLSSGLTQNLFPLANANSTYQHVVDELSMVDLPGEQFSYGPSNYYIFGTLMERKLTANGIFQNPLEYLETEIFDKIGLTYENWDHDPSGNPNIPNGCTITSRNWVKYGQFLLNKGKWNDEQIIESSFLEEMLIPTGPNPGHGNFAWLNNLNGYGFNPIDTATNSSLGGFIYHNGYTEIIGGLGAGRNRMYLIPSLDLIIIRQTLLDDDEFEDSEFLELLFVK